MSARPSYQRSGPWDAPDTLYFYGGRVLELPPDSGFGPSGRLVRASKDPRPGGGSRCRALLPSLQGDIARRLPLDHGSADRSRREAARRSQGRGWAKVELRPDWEEVKLSVMSFACLAKFKCQPFHRALLATGERALVENSPSDFIWGGRDQDGGYNGRNLLGLVLMEVRAKLRGSLVAA